MKNTRVLISGASIAGPALAFWLHRYGFDVTIVEKAREVRAGGQAVDFKGPTHHTVLQRMGILDAVKQASVADNDGTIVNAKGRKIGIIPGAFSGGEINIPRGDLARILYELTSDKCEYVFGDSITTLTETADGVDVTFTHGARRTFDIVIGADGIHSTVRKLAFGPESDYVTYLGYYYVLADLAAGNDDLLYNEPGRMVGLGGSKAPAFFVFASDPLPAARDDVTVQKQQMTNAYRGGSWRLPELMAKIPDATEFYLDSISRVAVDHYSRGRVPLSATPPTATPSAASAPGSLSSAPMCSQENSAGPAVTSPSLSPATKSSTATTRPSHKRSTPADSSRPEAASASSAETCSSRL